MAKEARKLQKLTEIIKESDLEDNQTIVLFADNKKQELLSQGSTDEDDEAIEENFLEDDTD